MHCSRTSTYFTGLAFWGLFLALLGVALVGCANDATCDPGQEPRGGYCVTVTVDAGPTTADAASAADAGACTLGDAGVDSIGTLCTDNVGHSECDCTAPYCSISPGESEGICTRTGCVEDPAVCPAGYMCMDLSVFDPELPSLCVPL